MFLAHSLCNKHRFPAHSQAGKDRLLAIEPPPIKPDKAPPRIVILLLVPCCSQQVGDDPNREKPVRSHANAAPAVDKATLLRQGHPSHSDHFREKRDEVPSTKRSGGS